MLAAADDASMVTFLLVYFTLAALGIRFLLRKWKARRLRAAGTMPATAANVAAPMHPVIVPRRAGRLELGPASDAGTGRPQPIEVVRDLAGPVPRRFDRDIETYLNITRPAWMSPIDPMIGVYKRQRKIRREGAIVWGVFVQANQLNFKPGITDVGGSVIYSLDPYYDQNPGDLQNLAAELYMLKGTDQADPDAATFARMLTLENSRGMGLSVPGRFTGGRRVLHSSMIFPRKHLPSGFVTQNILPVWADPTGRHSLLMVPAAYWPASLLAYWARPAPKDASTPAQPKPAED